MKIILRIALWSLAVGLGIFGGLLLSGALDTSGTDAAGRGLEQAFGVLICLVAAGAIAALLLAVRWRAWLWAAGAILALPLIFMLVATIGSSIGSARREQESADLRSGRSDFADQPGLFAVAESISKNDENAIRSAAKKAPDLNAPGRDGKTLLFFAVDQALERPELVRAVETLLSLGADPNYNNGQLNSFAMWRAVNGEVRLLRAMLDAGGNPNAPDFRGNPIIFDIWDQTYFPGDRPYRLRLLLDRGADVNSVLPSSTPIFPGYTIALFRARSGESEPEAYVDALELLKRGADPLRVSDEGMTFPKMLAEHRADCTREGIAPAPEFFALVEWLKEHGVGGDGL